METDQSERLAGALAEIRRRWGGDALRKIAPQAERRRFPTGIPQLDQILGGGILQGKVTEILGDGTSGRTTLALKLAAEVQGSGGPVVYIDLGYSFDPDYASRQDVEPTLLLLVRPALLLSGLDIAYQIIAKAAAPLVILDSTADILATLHGSEMLNAHLRKLSPLLDKSRSAVVFISPRSTRGSALAHYATLRLLCEREAWIQQGSEVLGYQTQVTVLKNRQGQAGKSVSIGIYLDGREAAHALAA